MGKEATIYICTTGQYELVGLIKLDMATERAVSGCGANAREPHTIAKHNTSFIALGLPGGRGRRRNLLQSVPDPLFCFVCAGARRSEGREDRGPPEDGMRRLEGSLLK